MTKPDSEQYFVRDDMTLEFATFLRRLWHVKKIVSGMTFVAALVAILVALVMPNTYRAEVLLAPNQAQSVDGLSRAVGQYGALLSSVGINPGGSGIEKTDLGIAVLKSKKFAADFIARHSIVVELMAGQGRNAVTGELEIDDRAYDIETGEWLNARSAPSSHDVYEEFAEILTVSEDKVSGFVVIGITSYSPTVAQRWVQWIVEDLNETVMLQDVRAAEQAIGYLELQVANTPLAGLQSVFFRLIEEQTKTVMLAQANPEYLFRIVDPAVVPGERHSPNRLLIVVAGALMGFALGALGVLSSGNFGQS